MTYYQCRCTDVSGACESKNDRSVGNGPESDGEHADPPGPRQPAGPARYTKDSSDDFRDMRKIADLIDSHRVRLKHNPGSGVWLICVIRSQNSPNVVYVLFPVVSVQVAYRRQT
jgi:hypothetical protein